MQYESPLKKSISERDLDYISSESGVSKNVAVNLIDLFDASMTVPFISRYRKEKIQIADELKVQKVKELCDYIFELNARKKTILSTIKDQNKLTDSLQKKIESVYLKSELEDLYLPFKPKRKTKASVARDKGLSGLALLLIDSQIIGEPISLAIKFLDENENNCPPQEALEGAGYILAEEFSENSEVRKKARDFLRENGVIIVSSAEEWADKRSKFEKYYNFTEKINNIPSHRYLAIARGEREKVLKTSITSVKDSYSFELSTLLYDDNHPRKLYLDTILDDALKRLIIPSIELDIRLELKKKSELEAVEIFSKNLESLLLSPPAGPMKLMAVDPGYKTGCKTVVLDEIGNIVEDFVFFSVGSKKMLGDSAKKIFDSAKKHSVKAIVIGNGTASRETEELVKKTIEGEDIVITIISEAGASVYSASKTGREEFPDKDVTVRGAVSIGRRFQDPLSELVKIDPKAIGVGQYQHDVNQVLLKSKLDSVVISVVNRVGVDLNIASYHLLKYVSGIGETLAKNIVEHRTKNGIFKNRKDLMNVRMYGEKAFQQSAGFLRIKGHEEPLDSTGIHPESYFIVKNISEDLGKSVPEMISRNDLLSSISPEKYTTEAFGLPTVIDIISELKNPGRDPRKDFQIFLFNEDVSDISDVKPSMTLDGVVTNVTNFGVFVDIGVHIDGLVHISEMSNHYISKPEEFISVGKKVKVKVISVDQVLKRINLSMKALEKKGERKRKKKKKSLAESVEQLKKKWGSR
ncbi:RNA-binding transcriptional accessory protein [candidate division WOR-3 bacterium]|nr:RNA-binding transcriptional accessory protein [candidate division WOR-3 bacterium]